MKCHFCGEEGLLNPKAKGNAKPMYVYDPQELVYYEVKPNQYLICRKCGRTDLFSSLREMSITEVEGLKYNVGY